MSRNIWVLVFCVASSPCSSCYTYSPEPFIITHLWYLSVHLSNVPRCKATQTDAKFVVYTGCPRRNVPNFGRVFPMLKYTDITQNTYVQSWTVTEVMAREKCGLLAGPRTVPVSWQPYPCPSLSVVSYYGNSAEARNKLFMYFLLGDKAVQVSAW